MLINENLNLNANKNSPFEITNNNNNKNSFNSPESLLSKSSFKPDYNEELRKLESFYDQLIKSKDLEQERILHEVDKILLEKETENEELKAKNIEISDKYNILVDLLKDYEGEKEDYQKSIIELTNKLEENKKASEKFIGQLKKLQTLKPEDTKILSQLGGNINSNNNILNEMIEKETKKDNLSQHAGNVNAQLCKACLLDINRSASEEKDKLGFINAFNFTNKFLEIFSEYKNKLSALSKTDSNSSDMDVGSQIRILDLENIAITVFEENKSFKGEMQEITNKLSINEKLLKEFTEKELKLNSLLEDLRKEKLSLQNKINEINQNSLHKDNLSVEKLEKQEFYYKSEVLKKDEEITKLKVIIAENVKKNLGWEDTVKNLRLEIEKKNDQLFEYKNKSIDKSLLQVYYVELQKNAESFISEKQKLLDKNLLIFKEVDNNIKSMISDMKQFKLVYDEAEGAKKQSYDSSSSFSSLNIENQEKNFDNSKNMSCKSSFSEKNASYLLSLEKILAEFENSFIRVEDAFLSNFILKNFSSIGKVLGGQSHKTHSRNNSVLVNNKKHSIICRMESYGNINTSSLANKNNSTTDTTILSTDGNLENLNNQDNKNNLINNEYNPNNTADASNISSLTRSNIDFESFNSNFSLFNDNIEQINMEYSEVINQFIQAVKFLFDIIKQFKKIFTQQNFDYANLKLEIELALKNQNFLKSSIIFLQQCTVESFYNIIPKGEFDDISTELNNFEDSIAGMDAPEIVKISTNIFNEINSKINNFINEKNLIVENLNEKLNYLNKEIELLQKLENSKNENKEKKDKATNLQLHKLQAQLKLKEEEINRLNERIEEHLKTINKISKEQSSCIKTSEFEFSIADKKEPQSSDSNNNNNYKNYEKSCLDEKTAINSNPLSTSNTITNNSLPLTLNSYRNKANNFSPNLQAIVGIGAVGISGNQSIVCNIYYI